MRELRGAAGIERGVGNLGDGIIDEVDDGRLVGGKLHGYHEAQPEAGEVQRRGRPAEVGELAVCSVGVISHYRPPFLGL